RRGETPHVAMVEGRSARTILAPFHSNGPLLGSSFLTVPRCSYLSTAAKVSAAQNARGRAKYSSMSILLIDKRMRLPGKLGQSSALCAIPLYWTLQLHRLFVQDRAG